MKGIETRGKERRNEGKLFLIHLTNYQLVKLLIIALLLFFYSMPLF